MNGFEILQIGFVNVNSLVSKVLYVKHFITKFHLILVAICETWLFPFIYSLIVAIDKRHVMCDDRSNIIRKQECCLYVANFLSFVSVDGGLLNVVAVFLTDLDIYIDVVYRPPPNTNLQPEHLLSFISDFCIRREVILLGDLNLPSLNWECENVVHRYVPPEQLMFF